MPAIVSLTTTFADQPGAFAENIPTYSLRALMLVMGFGVRGSTYTMLGATVLVIVSSLSSRDSSCHAPKKMSIWSVIVSSKQNSCYQARFTSQLARFLNRGLGSTAVCKHRITRTSAIERKAAVANV
jgi:hypothetical protein